MLWGGGYRRNNLATYLVATLFLALFSTPLLALTFTTSAYADTEYPSANKSLGINVYIDPVISIRALDSTGTNPITTLPISVTPTSTGTFAKNNLILQVDSTNSTGYSLYLTSDYKTDGTTSETTPATAASYTNSLVNLTYNDTITSLASTITPENPVSETDFSTTSSTYQNMWGISTAWNETFSGSTFSGGSATDYFTVPVNGTTTTIRDDVDTVSSNSRTSIGVGVNVNTNKEAGIYRNRLVFTSIANPLPVDYTLTFDKNTDAYVENLPEPMTDTVIAQSKTFTIPNTTPTRDGYQFIGWSTSATERQGSGSGPDGLYVAGDSFTVLSDDQTSTGTTTRYTGSATLYAVWKGATFCNGQVVAANQICYDKNGTDVVGEMPNQTTVYINSTTSPGATNNTTLSGSTTEFTLYSPNYSRTGYGFAGWNTRPDGTGTMFGPNQTLTSTDTASMLSDLSTKGLAFYAIWVPSAGDLQTWTGCSGMSNGDVTALTDSRDSNTYAVAKLADGKCWLIENFRYSGSGTQTTSFSTNNTTFYQQYSLTNIDRTLTPLAVSHQEGSPYYQWYSYGGLYSWLSAANIAPASNPTSPGDVSTSICPTNWRLPTSNGASKDFPALQGTLNNGTTDAISTFEASNNWRKYPNNFVFAGNWTGANAYRRGTYGGYWSSSVVNSIYAYYLVFRSTNVNPAYNNNKWLGFSVRCVYSAD